MNSLRDIIIIILYIHVGLITLYIAVFQSDFSVLRDHHTFR